MLRAELLKLNRSPVWVITILTPLIAVAIGTYTALHISANTPLSWESLTAMTLRAHIYYVYPIGIASLSAAILAMEINGPNWTFIRTSSQTFIQLVAAKLFVVILLCLNIQGLLIVGIISVGKLLFHFEGILDLNVLNIAVLMLFNSLPLVIFQLWLSFWFTNPFNPIVLCTFGCALSYWIQEIPSSYPIRFIIPQSLISESIPAQYNTSIDIVSHIQNNILLVLISIILFTVFFILYILTSPLKDHLNRR
ncbi:ABC transporter permease [Stomatohabitans albus]|uniref:ABC transporter permease n=1 Tax=Stomatohabitans albus TaxID=3110766 RepID=UPI00300C31E3